MAVLLGIFGFTAIAHADATGTWKWTSQGRQGNSVEWTLKLQQAGEKLTGTLIGFNNTETAIGDGSVKDGTVSFTVTRERNGEKFVTTYTGKLEGDTITGKVERDRNGQKVSNDWVAKRESSAATKPSM